MSVPLSCYYLHVTLHGERTPWWLVSSIQSQGNARVFGGESSFLPSSLSFPPVLMNLTLSCLKPEITFLEVGNLCFLFMFSALYVSAFRVIILCHHKGELGILTCRRPKPGLPIRDQGHFHTC